MSLRGAPSRFAVLSLAIISAGCLYDAPVHQPEPTTTGDTSEVHRAFFRGLILSYHVVDGLAIAQGDMVLGPAEKMEPVTDENLSKRSELIGRSPTSYRWPGGVIPYTLPQGTPFSAAVQAAIDHMNARLNPTVRFVPHSNETDFIEFNSGTVCASLVGRIGGQQFVNVTDTCPTGSLIHELGHVVGAWHEHTRTDRDLHVRILLQNIDPNLLDQFEITGNDQGADIGDYDYGSIMHYNAYAGSITGLPTIETFPVPGVPIGQRDGLSPLDIAGFLQMYGGTNPSPPPPQTAPTIPPQGQPQSMSVVAGSLATFSVSATGSGPLAYQWYKDGQLIPFQTGAQLAIPNAQLSDAGVYYVRVSNSAGSTASSPASLSVTPYTTPPPGGGGGSQLTNGVPVDNLSGGAGTELRFSIQVPISASALVIQISGGTGNADLYVSYGDPPTTTSYACRPYLSGNNESCTDQSAFPGTYYILVRGFTAFSGVRLLATYNGITPPPPPPPPVQNPPVIITQPHPATLTVPVGGSASWSVSASGNGLHYLWYKNTGQGPVPLFNSTQSQLILSNVQASDAGSYWVVVSNAYGSVTSAYVTLVVTSAPPPPPGGPLTNNVPVDNLSGSPGTELRYTFDVPAGSAQLTVKISGGVGDSDLYLKFGSPPTTTSWDCRPYFNSSDETCTVNNPAPGTYFIMVRGYTTFSGVRLLGSYGGVVPPPPTTLTLQATLDVNNPFFPVVHLSWNPIMGADYYVLYRNGVGLASVYSTSAADTFIPPTFSYVYQVFAIQQGHQIAASQLVPLSH
jgi:hypothetical protein